MAKRNKAKVASKSRKSALRVEALEQRQLLATVTGGGTEVGSNIQHPNGNVYDQVLMTGSSVTVTADSGQVTRISFLDASGDIVQAEFAGTGTLTVTLADFKAAAAPANYNQPNVNYVSGNASFIIQGSDATTNFSVFSVGAGNAVNQSLFEGGKTGGNNIADVQAIQIVSNPQNPGGFSNFGGIRAGNAVFGGSSGTVGIAAANVNVQGPVIIGDLDATNAGVPTLNFGANSQFGSLTVSGGDLVQSNGQLIVGGSGAGIPSLNFTSGATSAISTGSNLTAKVNANANLFTGVEPTSTTLDTATAFDLTGKSQADINNFFSGRTFTQALTITGELGTGFNISAVEFRGKVTIDGNVNGTITTSSTQAGVGFGGGLEIKGNLANTVTTNGLGDLTVTGALSGAVVSNQVGGAGGAVGNVSLGSVAEGRISAASIGNVSVTGNVTGDGAGSGYVFRTTGASATNIGSIGTLTVGGDVNLDGSTDRLILIDGTGSFGNVTISGGGTLGGTGTVAALNLGVIQVDEFGVGQSTTGTITVTDNVNLNWGGAVIGTGGVVGAGTLGNISITGGANTGSTLTISGRIGANDIGTDLVAVGNITVKDFNDVVLDNGVDSAVSAALIGGSKLGDVSVTTIAGTTSQTSSIAVWDFVSLDDGSGSTGEIMGNVTFDAGQTAGNTLTIKDFNAFASHGSGSQIGNVTLNGRTVSLEDDVWANTIGNVAVTSNAATFAGTSGIKSAGTVGTLTVTGPLTLTSGGDANIEVKDIGAINITGNLSIGAGKAAAITSTGNVASLTVGGNATFDSTNATNILVKTIGDITVTGTTTFTANHANGTIRANDGSNALDTIGNITLGRVVGAAGTEIRGSSIGNVTISAALTDSQKAVSALDIIAAPNAGTNSATSEQVALDGSNLSSYKIGNISVSSTLALAYTGTSLFDGDSSFVALGSIGNITLTGATAGAQQTKLFNAATDAAWFVAGDVDGLLANTTADLPSTFHLGTTGTATPNYTGGTVSIGNIQVNALQSATGANRSEVDSIAGSDAAAGGTIEGLGVLAGVRVNNAAGQAGDIISLNAASALNVAAIDADLKGTIGTVQITSNNAFLFRDGAANIAGVAGAATDFVGGIVAATSAGAVQGGAAIPATSTEKAVIIGDFDSAGSPDDNTVEDAQASNQIIVVVL